jgi:gliding motility-associated-like protein
MKRSHYLNVLILLLGLTSFTVQLTAQTTTAFRKNYDLAIFDLPGNIVEGLTPNTYVMAGTNLTFLPIYGTVTELNDTGAVNWSFRYSDASIGFQLNDIKKDVGNNQYITCGGSESNAAVFMVLDATGNVVISKRFSINEADGAWFNRVIKASDGGYVAVGYVTGHDPDGAGPETDFAPINYIDANGDPQTEVIGSPLIVKLDASGNHVWHQVFRYYTAPTVNPVERIYNDASFRDVVEVSDGYVAVGSYDVNQHLSATDSDGDDATPTDAVILKTTTAGAITYHKQIDNPDTDPSQNSKYLSAINTTSTGDIIIGGNDNTKELIQKYTGPGGFSNIFSRVFTYPGFLSVTDLSQIYEVNGSTDLVTMNMYIQPTAFVFANAIHRVNPTATSSVFGKRYDFNLTSILPRGGQTSDNGYISMSMTSGAGSFDYHVIKTDPNGDTPATGCPPVSFSPTPAAGPTTASDPSYTAWTGTPGSNTLTIFRQSISPTPSYVCTNIICTPPPNPTASATSTTICNGASTTINGAGSGAGVVYNVYTAATGGTNLGATPLVVSPTTTTTYYVESVITATSCPSAIRDPITITVNSLPTVTANATNTTICNGDPVTLTGGGATSYSWDNGVTDGVAFNPSSTTTYTVTGTDGNTCQNTAQVTVTVIPIPTVVANATSITICNGDPVTLTGSGATSYTWNNGVTDGVAFNPSTTTIYTVTGTTSGCSNTDQITVTVNSLPTVTANSTALTICDGDPVTLTGGGATSYTWDNGVTDGLAFNPSATTTYTVTGTDGNTCQNTAQVTVTVNTLPVVVANAAPGAVICQGDQVTLTGSGATSYSWDSGVTDGLAFTPIGTALYTVTGTDANSCQNTDTITVSVIAIPTVVANATNTTICNGDPVTLTGSGATSYSWDNGVTDGIAFSPSATTIYTVTGTAGTCSNTDQITITVNPLPTVTANSTALTICSGDPVTLTGGGATSYTWDNGVTDGVAFNPIATNTYTVTGTDGNSCQNTAQVTVTINALPTITTNAAPSATICNGDPVTLTGGGATSYTWDNGVTDGVAFNPSATTIYTVTGTDGNSCQNTAQITVTVNSLPTITATATPDTIVCSGDPVTLTGNGGVSYTWNNGVTDGVPFNPVATASYIVTGTDANGCINTAQINVNVVSLPNVTANSTSSNSICTGDTITLTGNGATTYTWDNGVTDGVPFVPAGTLLYTVTGTVGASCSNTDTITIFVNPLPTITANATNTTICLGDTVTFTGSGATTYTWDNGVTDGVPFIPTGTTTYTATGTDGNSCSNTDQITITVNPLPTIIATASPDTIVCTGDPITLTGNGGVSYIWDNGVTDGVSFNPIATTTYTVIGTDANGCTNISQINVSVVSLPTVIANSTSSNSICSGDTITLTGSGATSYTWDNGVTDGLPFVPTGTLLYTVTGTIGASCSNTDTITIFVNSLPTITASSTDTTICQGDQITLSGNGGTSYTWDNGVIDGVPFTPTGTTTYTATGTDANSCANTAQLTITVSPLPTISVTGTNSICTGDSSLLTASGGISYVWNTSDITPTITVNPITNTTYTVTGTDANGCINTGQITVTVLAPPTAAISGASNVCLGNNVVLIGSGGGSYLWNTGDTSSIINVNPLDTTTYTLITTIGTCVDSITITVNTVPTPTVILTPSPDTSIALGQSIDLNVIGGTSYVWNPNGSLSCSTCPNPIATPELTTTYCVYTTENSCTDTSCVTVVVDIICGEVFVPTAFSPNGDGGNDCLKVYNNCIESMVFKVYARWGEVVFETTDVDECWDGSYKGKDLNNAVFMYTLNATLINGEEVSLKGNVSLIR